MFWCRHDANRSADWLVDGGSLTVGASASLADYYHDTVQIRGAMEVSDGTTATVRFDPEGGSMRAVGRFLGADALLLGNVQICKSLAEQQNDQQYLTVEGTLVVNNNGLAIVKGDSSLGPRHDPSSADVVINARVSVKSDTWHETQRQGFTAQQFNARKPNDHRRSAGWRPRSAGGSHLADCGRSADDLACRC